MGERRPLSSAVAILDDVALERVVGIIRIDGRTTAKEIGEGGSGKAVGWNRREEGEDGKALA